MYKLNENYETKIFDEVSEKSFICYFFYSDFFNWLQMQSVFCWLAETNEIIPNEIILNFFLQCFFLRLDFASYHPLLTFKTVCFLQC